MEGVERPGNANFTGTEWERKNWHVEMRKKREKKNARYARAAFHRPLTFLICVKKYLFDESWFYQRKFVYWTNRASLLIVRFFLANCFSIEALRVLTYRCTSSLSIFLPQNKDERGLETTPGIHVIRVASLRRVQRKRVTWTCPRSHVACPEGSLLPYNEGAQFFSCSLDSSTVEEPFASQMKNILLSLRYFLPFDISMPFPFQNVQFTFPTCLLF